MHMGGGQLRAQVTIANLEALDRALTEAESLSLERALLRLGPKRDVWRWSAKEDRKVVMLIKRRGYSLRIKPFERNDEVRRLANDLGRSYESVLKRIQRLRKGMAECPSASKRRGR
jgi:hypothetical protein